MTLYGYVIQFEDGDYLTENYQKSGINHALIIRTISRVNEHIEAFNEQSFNQIGMRYDLTPIHLELKII